MKKLALGATLVAAVVAVGVLSGFGPGGCGRGDRPARMQRFANAFVEDALDDLDATDAQRTQVHALKDGLLKDAEALRSDHEKARAELLSQWNAANPDAARVHSVVDGRIDALRAFAHRAADAALQLHGTLTPGQRAEVAQRIERHHH